MHKMGLCFSVALVTAIACAEKHPCAPDDIKPLRMQYEKRAIDEIHAGACSGFVRVDDCPSYKLIELEFTLEAERMRPCR